MAINAGTIQRQNHIDLYRDGGAGDGVQVWLRRRRLTSAEETSDPTMPNPLTEASLDYGEMVDAETPDDATWDPITMTRADHVWTIEPL